MLHDSGHIIIAISVVYFILASYAIFFSAFLPLSGIYVGATLLGAAQSSYRNFLDPGYPGPRHPLQIFRDVADTHDHLFCHRQLGWMAILPEFLGLNYHLL